MLDDDEVGVGVDLIDDEVGEEVLGDGGDLVPGSDVLLDADCELLCRIKERDLEWFMFGFHEGLWVANK